VHLELLPLLARRRLASLLDGLPARETEEIRIRIRSGTGEQPAVFVVDLSDTDP
jgi:hypothetical protein